MKVFQTKMFQMILKKKMMKKIKKRQKDLAKERKRVKKKKKGYEERVDGSDISGEGDNPTPSKSESLSDDHPKFTQLQTEGINKYSRGIGSLLGSILGQTKLGTDLLRAGISLPAWLYEPLSLLQRQTEMLEYSHLLDKAAECKDPIDRMAYIAAFAVSGFSASQRYHNAFNPILGETFEFIDEKRGFRYISEQVSHHPPISATHAEKDKLWVFYQNASPTTSFLGNALSIDTQGKTHVYFPQTKEHYFYTNPKARVHNLIFGKMWVEHHGEVSVTNLKNGDTCTVEFKKCGFFSNSVEYKVEGFIKNSEGDICVELTGRWDQYLEGTWLVDTKDSEKGKTEELWRIFDNNFFNNKLHLSKFAASLIELDEEVKAILPPTDSRLRLDILQLVSGEPDIATKNKKMMEERQRQDKKKREQDDVEWVPSFFHRIPDEDGGHMWVYCGDYWEQREKKIKTLKSGEDVSDLLNGGNAKGTSGDFKSYEV